MKSKMNRILAAAVLITATLFCWTVYAQKGQTPNVVWEYNISTSLESDNPVQLAQLGREGWELTSVRTEEQMVGNFRQKRIYYYLKRPKQIAK